MKLALKQFFNLNMLIILILTFNSAIAMANTSNLEQQWESYWKDSSKQIVKTRFPYQACFEQAAKDQKLPLSFLIAVARGESDFNPRAVSKSNALGIMQLLWPGTAKDLGFKTKEEVFQPCANIKAGAKYLRTLLIRYNNNPHKALAAYNYGLGRISIKGSKMPTAAADYSEYIFSHLAKVIDQDSVTPGSNQQRSGKLALLEFNRLFRAKAFVNFLQKVHPQLKLEWFRGKYKSYGVFLTYLSSSQKRQSIKILKKYALL